MVDERWIETATSLQEQAIRAVLEHGVKGAAEKLGVARSTVSVRLHRARLKWEALQSFTTERTVHLKGGKIVEEWARVKKNASRDAAIRDIILNIPERLEKRTQKIEAPTIVEEDLLSVIPIGDAHLGLLCSPNDAGRKFDLTRGQREIAIATDLLIESSRPTATALIINQGDFFHVDNYSNETKRSKHKLDTSDSWPAIAEAGVDFMFDLIHKCLRKHRYVHVINVAGNHDDCTSVMLGIALNKYFAHHERVFIQYQYQPFYYFKFGSTMIGATHGHLCRIHQLPNVMHVDQRANLADVDFRHWYTGHVHSDKLFERGGCVIETVRTLAPSDRYAFGSGWRSGADIKCDTYHKRFGRINRSIVPIEMVLSVTGDK